MADKTLFLSGESAAAFCAGLLDTGRFILVRTREETSFESGLYGTADTKSETIGTVKQGVIKGIRTHSGAKPKKPDDEDDNPIRDSGFGNSAFHYAVRGSYHVVASALDVLKKYPDAFEIQETERASGVLIRCFGSPERTASALREIRDAV